MKKTHLIIPLLAILLVQVSVGLVGQEMDNKSRILFIDETRSFELSMRVQGLVSGLKETEGLEVDTVSIEVENPLDNPVTEVPEEPYDLVIVIPATIETGAITQVWLITKPFSELPLEERKGALAQLERLKEAVSRAFEGKVSPVGVNDDIIPAYFSSLFLREGVLR